MKCLVDHEQEWVGESTIQNLIFHRCATFFNIHGGLKLEIYELLAANLKDNC